MPALSDEARAERRAKREARREKQRAQNLVRAQKMHVARLEYEKAHPRAAGGAAKRARAPRGSPVASTGFVHGAPAHAHVGCSGWFYWHWRDHIYKDLPGSRWFEVYAKRFRTVELNAPFYSWPTLATVATWNRQIGRRKFVYTVKVNELITHTRRFVRTATLVKDFGLIADLLGPRFGCFLFQLPPSFHYSAAALRRILAQLDPGRRNVVEFRHRSWWSEKVYAAFREHGAIFCSTSGPRLPDELVKTADDVYIRFHGTKRWYRHDYTPEELAVWTERIRKSGAKTVWAYFNNDREGYAIANARELARQLRQFK